MSAREAESFLQEVAQKLKAYVYRRIDLRYGEAFHVGKGKGNRVFAHIRGMVFQVASASSARKHRRT